MESSQGHIMNTYGRAPVTFVSGSGCVLVDSKGKSYLDCLAGLAVVSAGHANPDVAEAVYRQASELVHVSNLYWTLPMQKLAAKLHELSGGWGEVFFCNSGAEANECAIKLARKWAGAGRYKIICAQKSFHGRTLGALAATGQPHKWKGFEPLPEGFVHVPFNDIAAFETAIDAETAALYIEPLQGEGGVFCADPEFLKGLRALCDRHNLLLIFDEVQCGIGRTGSFWAWQSLGGVRPDILASAKALANGLPIGACMADAAVAKAFSPGDHASTFGGGPLIAAAALATLDFLQSSGTFATVCDRAELFVERLRQIPAVQEVRGKGFMLAVELGRPLAKRVVDRALALGLLCNNVSESAIRLTPPLIISEKEIDQAAALLKQAIREVQHESS